MRQFPERQRLASRRSLSNHGDNVVFFNALQIEQAHLTSFVSNLIRSFLEL